MDILSIEKSGNFRGKFHVLGGKISPLDGVEPDDLRIEALEKRLAQEPVGEIVLALGTDVEGDATGFYLAKRLARPGLKITRIAHGLPAGTGLEFADELTLSRAIEGRREVTINAGTPQLLASTIASVLEPEGRHTDEVYVNGLSTSLPREVQDELLRQIPADVLDICRRLDAKTVTKGKSMIGEEIAINDHLEQNGIIGMDGAA